MTAPLHRIGEPLPRSSLFPAPGLFPPDSRATLRRRAADRAMCRRLGYLAAIISSVRVESARYRGALALFHHDAADVTASLVEWHRRNTAGQS